MKKPSLILISSCLIGLPTRWDGNSKKIDKLVDLVKKGKAIFICPEQLGGLSTPRDPAEIEFGKSAADVLEGQARIISRSGKDITSDFIEGAKKTLNLCKQLNIKKAILYKKSPSCGSRFTYDGTFTGCVISGRGITSELLIRNGIKVFDEENY